MRETTATTKFAPARESVLESLAAFAPDGFSPRALPWPARVLVLDTNYLASTACHLAVRTEVESLLQQALAGGRGQMYIAAHVPGEMSAAISKVAKRLDPKIEALAWEIWQHVLAPRLRVVDLPVREHLDPEVREVMRNPYAKGGDVDDLPTAALARFLAPAVLLSEDGVFAKVGIAVPESVPAGVQAAARAARDELAVTGGVRAGVIAGRTAYGASRAGLATARAHPEVVLGLLLAVSVVGWMDESRRPGSIRARMVQASAITKAVADVVGRAARFVVDAHEEYDGACAAAVTVRRRAHQGTEEAAAAVLARAGGVLTIAEIHEEMCSPRSWSSVVAPHRVSLGALLRSLREHSAFVESARGWSIGRSVF